MIYTFNIMKKGPKKGTSYINNHPHDFGKTLAALRRQKGLTQDELAEKMNTTKRMISHWEREVKNPSVELVQKLADALNISVKYFYQQKSTTQNDNISRALHKRLELVKNLPPKAQKSVQEYIDMIAKLKQA